MPAEAPLLLYANSEENANLFHATGFFAPDPFACLILRSSPRRPERRFVLLNDLEIDRGRREARVDGAESYSGVAGRLSRRLGRPPAYPEILAAWLKGRRVARVRVPEEFPMGLGIALQEAGLIVEVAAGPVFPDREIKSPEELRAIRRALAITEAGMERAFEVLRNATIQRRTRRLLLGGTTLTSERLRAEIDTCILRLGGLARGTIVACGEQGCDPHERGTGPLSADQLLILDIFPRDTGSGFYGDLTRTVVRGRATPDQHRLWQTCLEGQEKAIQSIRPGAEGGSMHREIQNFFTEAGYPTRQRNGRWEGFFHGTGHGLGLEIHEEPRFAAATFRPGQVFTVEPGIYIPKLGGVRHEDVIVVTSSGCELLTSIPKPFEL